MKIEDEEDTEIDDITIKFKKIKLESGERKDI